MDRNEIINRINICRNNANLSARALSQRIELNDGYINRLESKKDFLPSLEVLLKIIEECGVSAEHFFYENIQSTIFAGSHFSVRHGTAAGERN